MKLQGSDTKLKTGMFELLLRNPVAGKIFPQCSEMKDADVSLKPC